MRLRRLTRKFYMPRQYALQAYSSTTELQQKQIQVVGLLSSVSEASLCLACRFKEETRRAGRPYPLPRSFAGWLLPAWRTSEDELVRVAGYDAAMYIKVLTLGKLAQQSPFRVDSTFLTVDAFPSSLF